MVYSFKSVLSHFSSLQIMQCATWKKYIICTVPSTQMSLQTQPFPSNKTKSLKAILTLTLCHSNCLRIIPHIQREQANKMQIRQSKKSTLCKTKPATRKGGLTSDIDESAANILGKELKANIKQSRRKACSLSQVLKAPKTHNSSEVSSRLTFRKLKTTH